MIERLLTAIIVFVFTPATLAAQDKVTHQVETEHLMVVWQDGNAGEEAVEAAKQEGEQHYTAIRDMLGHEPDFKVVIMLDGPAERPDGSWGYPHVDSWGRIHLYQFGPTHHSYLSALAHEMVHTFRIHRAPHHDWFFEEGFAEFVALRVNESRPGFPWYGFSPTIVAGQWFESGEAIPLEDLRDKHRALNQPCKAQSYSLRAVYFDYLGKEYGDDKVLAFAAEKESGSLSGYLEFFGKDFADLNRDWQASLRAEYAAIEDASEQAKRYRRDTPVQYMPVCQPGKDF